MREIHRKQEASSLRRQSAPARGASVGTLMGNTRRNSLFMNPLAGSLVGGVAGAGSGALQGKLADYCIDDLFVNSLGSTIEPNSSVIFLLVRKAVEDRVMPRLSHYDARVLDLRRRARLRTLRQERRRGPRFTKSR